MELTKEQIQKVEHYLETKNFHFIDLKPEILDHIISDIENLMIKNVSFDEAYEITTSKWKKHFKETHSMYFGLLYPNSKIVIQKGLKLFKNFWFLYCIIFILPELIFKLFPTTVTKTVADFCNGFISAFSVGLILYVVWIAFKIYQSKVKTTYSFIIKTQYSGLLLLILGIFALNIFDKNGTMNPLATGLVSCGFFIVYICHYFYKKHKVAIKKYKIS